MGLTEGPRTILQSPKTIHGALLSKAGKWLRHGEEKYFPVQVGAERPRTLR